MIVIPIYKSFLNKFEYLSLIQTFKIFTGYSISIVCPNSLNTDFLKRIISSYSVERFDDSCFIGLAGYNKLLLSDEFYKRFIKYEYLLIIQLDVFVFKNDL